MTGSRATTRSATGWPTRHAVLVAAGVTSAATAVVCHHCEASTDLVGQGRRWCGPCGIWLVPDPVTRQWVSHAECLHRGTARRAAARARADSWAVTAALARIRRAVPTGWTVDPSGSPRTCVRVRPPAGSVDVAAYLVPPRSHVPGWTIHVDNRARGVAAAVFGPAGTHADRFDDPGAAARAAVLRLAAECDCRPPVLARPSTTTHSA